MLVGVVVERRSEVLLAQVELEAEVQEDEQMLEAAVELPLQGRLIQVAAEVVVGPTARV